MIGTHQLAAVDTNTDAAGQPKLTELGGGNVLVVWDDNNTAASDGGPQASIYTASGGVVAEDIDLFTPDTSTGPADIDVAAVNGGGFVVGYAEAGDIFYRSFDSAGVQVGGPNAVNTVTAGTQGDAQVVRLADGAFALVWTDTAPADDLIKGRIFEANGTPRTGELTMSPGAGFNTQPSIAALPDGGFALAYADTGWAEPGGAGAGISLGIVSSAGIVGAPVHANLDSALDENHPDVTVLANGFIAVTWTRPNPVSSDIDGRIFDQAGAPVVNEISIAASGDDEVDSALSALGAGLFITSWQDELTDGDLGSIASQISELARNYTGDGAVNAFTGDVLRDDIFGLGGADSFNGGGGDDTIDGGVDEDLLEGGSGADLLQGGGQSDLLLGDDGNDRIYAGTAADPHTSTDGDEMSGGAGVDRIRGAAGDDTCRGGTGEDKITGGAGADAIDAGSDDDKLKGASGDDTIEGGTGADTINGGVGDDLLFAVLAVIPEAEENGDQLNGANGDDTIIGSGGADNAAGLGGKDVMRGGSGGDTLNGGAGKDLLTGGLGADRLTGGSEKDTFRYFDVLDSANGAEDVITDAGNQDFIDLSGIDAKTGNPGDQAFTLVGAFGGNKGELVVAFHANGVYAGFTTVQGDVDGDGSADFTIKITGDVHNFDNFVL